MSKWIGGGAESADENQEMFRRFTIDQAKKYGEGGYGATFAAQDTQTGLPAAVKVIDTRRMRLDAIKKECRILEGLDHENVIKVLGHGTGRQSSGQVSPPPAPPSLRRRGLPPASLALTSLPLSPPLAVPPLFHIHGAGQRRRAI